MSHACLFFTLDTPQAEMVSEQCLIIYSTFAASAEARLIIEDIDVSDEGVYTCIADNGIGNSTNATANVDIYG